MSQTESYFPPLEMEQTAPAQTPRTADDSGKLLVFDAADFYRQHAPRLYYTALSILKDRDLAQDAVQEAFKNIFIHLGRFRGESRLETWMTRIVVNACLAYIRKNRIRLRQEVPLADGETMPAPSLPDRRPTPFETTRRREVQVLIRTAMSRLKPIHREVVYLHDIQQLTLEEISARLGKPAGTIKSRLFYGRKELQTIINNLTAGNACSSL